MNTAQVLAVLVARIAQTWLRASPCNSLCPMKDISHHPGARPGNGALVVGLAPLRRSGPSSLLLGTPGWTLACVCPSLCQSLVRPIAVAPLLSVTFVATDTFFFL